jgi:uncharacterized protein (DUF305 family)
MFRNLGIALLAVLLTGCASSDNAANQFSANDLMFASMMVPHHEQAIVMSELALKNSKNPEILELATEIKNAQAPEIAEMKSWGDLDMGSHAGHGMKGMLSDAEINKLAVATGPNFDQLFVEGMIKHHQGALEMAEDVANSRNPKVSALANQIIAEQKRRLSS